MNTNSNRNVFLALVLLFITTTLTGQSIINQIGSGTTDTYRVRNGSTNAYDIFTIRGQNGNAGFGTSTPETKLHVIGSGPQRVRIQSTDDQAGVEFDGNSADGRWTIYNPQNSDELRFHAQSTAQGNGTRVIFKTNGNVGIGTTTPSAHLHVMGLGKQRIKVASTNDQAGILMDGNDSDGSWLLQSPLNSSDLRFVNLSTANGDGIRMTLKSNGNVGIGYTDPLSKLSVGGAGNSDAAISGVTASIPGFGVFGEASNDGAGVNYGGYFIARGSVGRGVYSSAVGSNGTAVFGRAYGTSGYAVHGWASSQGIANNYGGYFSAGGSSGTGVRGVANHIGSYTNYGGYFIAMGQSGHGVHAFADGSSAYAGFFEGRGYFSGNVGIGITNPTTLLHIYTNTESEIAVFENHSTSDPDGIVIRTGNDVNPDNTDDFIIFQDGDGDTVGSIDGNGTGGVSYNTTSDARLKTKIRDYFDGLQTVNKIKVKQYEKKSAPGVERIGLIAQELQKVYPQAVSGSPTDDVDEDPMMVDYGSLTPILISALQEQNKLIEDLTNRIKYLESN